MLGIKLKKRQNKGIKARGVIMQNPFTVELKDRVAVITGAGGVLCSMFARSLAQCGARIALLDLNGERVEELALDLQAHGYIARGYKADVLDRAMLEEVHKQILADLGICDILINGAGGNHPRATTSQEYFDPENIDQETVTFFDLDKDGISFVFDLNFLGTLLPTQVFAREMSGRPGATIINISSLNAYRPLTKIPAYSAAKAAISNLTQWMAVHFSNSGIRVNAIAPGFFITRQNEKLLFTEAGQPTYRAEKIIARTPFARFGKAEELLGTLLYLVSEKAAGFITGAVIPVDGGFSAFSGV